MVYTAYGCLVNGRCVCAGYAAAYKVLLDRLGIPCVYVVGWGDRFRSDVGHAWNRVVIGGRSYYVDVTWDEFEIYDDDGNQKYPEIAQRDYFNITTAELERTHKIDDDRFTQPACTSQDYNYFVYNGYQVDGYDFDKFIRIANAQKEGNSINVRFSDPSDAQRAEKEFESGGWSRIGRLNSGGFVYLFNDESGCAIIICE